jgi:hypothetical protein
VFALASTFCLLRPLSSEDHFFLDPRPPTRSFFPWIMRERCRARRVSIQKSPFLNILFLLWRSCSKLAPCEGFPVQEGSGDAWDFPQISPIFVHSTNRALHFKVIFFSPITRILPDN